MIHADCLTFVLLSLNLSTIRLTMKTITATVTLQFDSIGNASPMEQATKVVNLVNEILSASGINSEPQILAVLKAREQGFDEEAE